MTYFRLLSLCILSTILSFLFPLHSRAQQLPNNGFEEAWVDCIPWTSTNNTKAQGTTPPFWNVSNTIGTGSQGNTTISSSVKGLNSNGAVYIENKEITVLIVKKVIPGYFGLGTCWSTSTGTGKNTDGGQFGGYAFTYRPDELSFYYTSSGSLEPTVVAYLWKGTFIQNDVPANIVVSGNPTKVNMEDRDRNILGMNTDQGGNITQSGERVASINVRIKASTSDWEHATLPFTYSSEISPEKINVIFAAGDYFSQSPTKDNTLTIDDVKLIYYSRLKSLAVDGVPVEGFDPDKFSYTLSTQMPANAESVTFELLGEGKSATPKTVVDRAKNTITITVTGVDADSDGEKSHTYTLKYAAAPFYSRISGVTIGDKTYPVAADGKTIDATSLPLPMPEVAAVKPVLLTGGQGTPTLSSLKRDTEKGTITFSVSNTGADTDGLKKHDYIVQFPAPVISRLKSLEIVGDEFSPTVYEYTVDTYLPDNEDELGITLFDGTTAKPVIERLEPTADHQPLRITLTGSGPDFDGNSSHTYTLLFNLPAEEHRSVRLSSITINDTPLTLTTSAPLILSYTIPVDAPASVDDIRLDYAIFTTDELSADGTTVKIDSYSPNTGVLRIVVANSIPDTDGKRNRTYTFRFIPYLSRLTSVTVADTTIELFNETGEEISAEFPFKMPAADQFSYVLPESTAGTITVSPIEFDKDNAVATIKVSNSRPDADGLASRTYTLQFALPHFSRLSSLAVDGEPIADFSPDRFNYDVNIPLPSKPVIDTEVILHGQGKPTVSDPVIDRNANTITITVTNSEPDVDGLSSHTYTLTFLAPPTALLSSIAIDGKMIDGFSSEKLNYQLKGLLPAADRISATALPSTGNLSEPQISVDNEAAKATIVITNGSLRSVYTLSFEKPCPSTLATISVNGATVSEFNPDKTDYSLTVSKLPASSDIVATPTDSRATVSVALADNVATVTVTSPLPASESGATTVYTIHFTIQSAPGKPDTPVTPPTSGKTIYDGTLTILMLGEDLTGGGQQARVEITDTDESHCTFLLPDFTLDLGDGPASLGDITVENVAVTTAADGTRTFTGSVNGLELADGAIDADVTLSGTSSPEGVADMTIRVNWEGIDIDVHFNGQAQEQPEQPSKPVTPPADGTTVYDGTLTILMLGEDLTDGGQQARVEITDTDEGHCTFLLPDFTLDLGDGPASLGDITVENVAVTTAADGTRTFTGSVTGMELADGAIVADVTLSGTSSPEGVADMTIRVNWEGIDIDVHFNGQAQERPQQPSEPITPPADGWKTTEGEITVELNGYDITEGGTPATLRIREDENGTYTFLVPSFTLALDADSEPALLGDITVSDISAVPLSSSLTRFTGTAPSITLAEGSIKASASIDGTISSDSTIVINVDVDWLMESGRHIPIMVRFTNTPRSTATTTPTGYRGVLTAAVDGEPDRTFDVALIITPHSPGRCTATISGLNFSPASRAAAVGSEITIPGVCVTPLAGGSVN